MKKIYILICALAISFSAIAQLSLESFTVAEGKKSHKTTLMNSEKSMPFWSENFATGIPATWTNSTAPWVYRGPTTTPNQNTGSQGAYASNGVPIASATASNGFIIFDSDYYDNNGTQGNFGNGMYPTPHNGVLKTNMIDLSAYSDVMLTFSSYFRTFQGQAFVDFYVGGVFTERVEVHPNLAVNDATPTNEIAMVRLPVNVVGNPNVQMSFVFDGTTQSNVNGSGYYFWQIDDLSLSETPLNLIELQDGVVGGFWIDYLNYQGAGLNGIVGLDYTITPTSQLANHPYVIEGIIRNNGAADQTCRLKYEVFGAGSYSGASALTSVLAYSATNTLDSAIVAASPSLVPPIGEYGVAIWAESDSAGSVVAITDTTYKLIEISDFIYGKDLGELNSNSSWILGGPGDQWHFTTRFEMYANEQLYSLKAYITDESVVGAEVKAVLYESDSTSSSGNVFLDESDPYTITPSDRGNWVDIPFVSPIQLLNGYAYEFGIAGVQHPTDSVFVGTTDNSLYNGEHRLFDESGLNSQSNGTATWYYLTDCPMVRMNFDQGSPSGVVDSKQSIFNVYPNPSNGVFVIELEKTAKYDVRVYNVLGQTVYTTSTNAMNTTIDLSSFDKGIYTVELKDENTIYTEKVIVE